MAAERDVLCSGFRRDTDEELRRRYALYVGATERLSRSDLERAANHRHLARPGTEGSLLACDVQHLHYQACRGWSDFSNEELSDFCLELTGVRPTVSGEITLPNM